MKLYLVDLGVLLMNDDPEYEIYKNVYDKMHSFYDTIQYFAKDKDKAIEEAKKHVNVTDRGAYAVVCETEYDGSLTDDEINSLSVEKYADHNNVLYSCCNYGYFKENFIDYSRMHPVKVINDFYSKQNHRQWGEDPATPFNTKIRAVNTMYGYLYNKGILKEKSFVSKDCASEFYFAIDAKELEPYRDEMLNSDVENAELAVSHIFDVEYSPCTYCGAITPGWTMKTYRSNCGCVGSSWECIGCRDFDNHSASKISEMRYAKGTIEAVKLEWSMFDWKDGALE